MPKEDGYKNIRPPQKGEIRNPTGKGGWHKSIRHAVRSVLKNEDAEAALKVLYDKALEGDTKALQLFIEYAYEKDDKPIEINLTTDDATNRLIERIKGQ